MRLLLLGGTGFLGRHLVDAVRARGHEPTVFDRGITDPGLFLDVERLYGDRAGDLAALSGRSWDAVVDASGFTCGAVAASMAAFAGRVAHYTFVSSISAYAGLAPRRVGEDALLAGPGPDYGAQKAEGERLLARDWPGLLLRVRPGLLVGPHDRTGRFAYWVRRVAAGGDVLVPGPPERHVQVLDARDLALWLTVMIESRAEGVFNAVGPERPLTMEGLLEICRLVTGADARFVWVDPESLLGLGVEPWSDLPLWPSAEFAGIHEIDGRRAFGEGLQPRAVEDTVRDVLAWENANPGVSQQKGLTPEREKTLLERAVSR